MQTDLAYTDTWPIEQVQTILAKPTIYFGVGAIQKFSDICQQLNRQGISRLLFVTGASSYERSGAWAAIEPILAEEGMEYRLYNKISPNPLADQVDEAVALGRDFQAQAVVAIGGGSPIDAGKGIATLLACNGKTARDLYTCQFEPGDALPIVAINLTHGTGTEANRYSVVSIPELDYKPGLGYDCFYPTYSITDPALMQGLPQNQARYTSIDAINHALEAATSALANPFSVQLAQHSIALVAKYLPLLNQNPQDIRARYWLAYAALSAGIAIDNGAVHITHALEHPLSALKHELPHALGLAMLAPSVWKRSYVAAPQLCAQLLAPLVPGLVGTTAEADEAARGLEAWFDKVGVPDKLEDQGFDASHIERLTELVYTTPTLEPLLQIAPVQLTREEVAELYQEALKPLRQLSSV